MEISYKLVGEDGRHGKIMWLPVGTINRPPRGKDIVAHATPELAVLMNPIHADIDSPLCLRVGIVGDGQWKSDGMRRWTTCPVIVLGKAKTPDFELEELVAWAIVASTPHPSTREWAVKWLSGEDRTYRSAEAAEEAAEGIWDRGGCLSTKWAATAAKEAAWAVASGMPWLTRRTKEAAARTALRAYQDPTWREANLMAALAHARAILAGEFPAEWYAAKLLT